jgi:alpha-glucosidase
MNKFNNVILTIILVLSFQCINANVYSENIKSPNGLVFFNVNFTDGHLTYNVNFKGKTVIEKSLLGLKSISKEIGKNVLLDTLETYKIDETYTGRGVHSVATNRCNGAIIKLNENKANWILEVRVFDDGVAFRYLFDAQKNDSIIADNSTFKIPKGSTVWSQNNIIAYEGKYRNQLIDTIKNGEIAGPPVTIQLKDGNGYVSITEAGLVNFAGMSLISDGKRSYRANLTGKVSVNEQVQSPWRVIMLGSNLNSLVNNDMVPNLSPKPDVSLFPKGCDTEWIKPGRSVWSWLADKREVKLGNMKEFSKMASELGFEYNLVDEGWGNWKEDGKDQWDLLRELVDYSNPLGVKIWVWKAYPDRKGIAGIKDSLSRREFFKKCKAVGVVGLKIDFFDSEKQEVIDFYQNALRDAAKCQLMLNFHGANKPTGESRTFPNEMTREGIRGLENQPPWATFNTVLPFTRYLAGHADFTPVHFGKRIGETSWAHQMASAIVFTSPLLVYGADPKSMLENPFVYLIKSIPTTWDETIVLPQSAIGELALFARRKGDTWFVAALNGTTVREVKIKLSFLANGKYNANIACDDKNNQHTARKENLILSNNNYLILNLNASGGLVAQLSKINSKD